MTRLQTPLERLLSTYWDRDPTELLAVLEQRFGVRVEREQLIHATDVAAFAAALKHQVDHPGRLERVAERLLRA